jgi:hypothetical protein
MSGESLGPSAVPSRVSPISSSSGEGLVTPSITNVTDYSPAIVHNGGYVEHHRSGSTAEDAQKV